MNQPTNPVYAVFTPLNADLSIDYSMFRKSLEFIESKGVQSILICGSNGEFCTQTDDERLELLRAGREAFSGTILFNVSHTAYPMAITLAQKASEYCDALLVLPPYYQANLPYEGVRDFFVQFFDAIDKPTYLYHFPTHSQNPVSLQLAEDLARRYPHFIGVKDSMGNLDNALGYTKVDERLQIFLGSDMDGGHAVERGLAGSVTGAGNPIPEVFVPWARREQDNQALMQEWSIFQKEIGMHKIPIIKAAMGARVEGFQPYVRPPYKAATEEQIEKIRAKVKDLISRV